MPGNVSPKIDALPFDPGKARTQFAVYDATSGSSEVVDASGAVMRIPAGSGSDVGGAILTATPLWYENGAVTWTSNAEKVAAGRPVDEKWGMVTIAYMTSKLYRAGMVLQDQITGEIFQVNNVENSDDGFRKQYLTIKAVI